MLKTLVMAYGSAITFVWRIEHFSRRGTDSCFALFSESFVVESLGNTSWYLRIRSHLPEEDRETIFLDLCREKDGKESVPVDYELSFLNEEGLPLVTTRGDKVFSSKDYMCGWMRLDSSAILPDDSLIVKCQLWNCYTMTKQPAHCSAVTRITTKQNSVLFRINNFHTLKVGKTRTLRAVAGFGGASAAYTLEFTMSGKNATEAFLDVEVRKVTPFLNLIDCILSLEDRSGELVNRQKLCLNGRTLNFREFIKRQILMERKNDYLPENVLSLHCEFSLWHPCHYKKENSNCDRETLVISESVINTFEPPPVIDSRPSISQQDDLNLHCPNLTSLCKDLKGRPGELQDDLLYLYKERSFSDFELRAEGTSFPAHKTVLAARSPVFKALFTSDMKEASSGVHDIPDLDSDTLNRLLLFLYGDTIGDLEWESAAKLYYAADKYQVLSLRRVCCSYLGGSIDGSNVCDILELADRHGDEELKRKVDAHLMKHADEIIKSVQWEEFMIRNLNLAAKTMRTIISQPKVEKNNCP